MKEVNSVSQSASINERKIIGGILVANECMGSWKKSSIRSLFCEIDLEKAFDRVDWGFLK